MKGYFMIDVIIPAYNCFKTLDKTLSSLVSQTDMDFCVTVVDDCSTENIKIIIDEYSKKLDIAYIRNKRNIGCGMSRQVGIDNTTCSHFTFLDSDDMFMPYTVEVFNSLIKSEPKIEYVHTYFYEQANISGVPVLTIHQDGFTWCHGKLYNREKVNYFNIRNDEEIQWADDSFFNSMCSELLKITVVGIPTLLWCNNPDSVMRKDNPERDLLKKQDFINAMIKSCNHVLKYKKSVGHLEYTIEIMKRTHGLTDDECKQLINISQEVVGYE